MSNTLTRGEVYKLIDGERTYQDNLGADRKRDPSPTITLTQAEFFTLMHVYLTKAEVAWANNPGEYVEAAQDHVRKIAAMCVQSMEKYGAPARAQLPAPQTQSKITPIVKHGVQIPEDIKTRVYTDIGAASMCWQHVENAGVFDSSTASTIANNLCHFIVDELEKKVAIL